MRWVFLAPIVVLTVARPLDMLAVALFLTAGAAVFHWALAPRRQ